MEYFRIFLEYAKYSTSVITKNRRADWRPGRENLAERTAEEKSGIFHGIFLEYGGSREEYEKNILELFQKIIVFMPTGRQPAHARDQQQRSEEER